MEQLINESWDNRAELNTAECHDLKESVAKILERLDRGEIRVCEKKDGVWQVNQWVKKAVLLSFKLNENEHYPNPQNAYDKVPLKFAEWTPEKFKESGIRAIPGSVARHGAYIGSGVVLMPSFVNIGAYVDEGTMVDTWVTIGSCAQVGKNCHISGGVGLGGVLEPLQANPVIIEDNCFIGARSEIVEGVTVREGAVIGMGVFIGSNTPIFNRVTGETLYGEVPPYAVVLAGSMPSKPLSDGSPGPHLNCPVIIKQVDERTRSKTGLNDLLRP